MLQEVSLDCSPCQPCDEAFLTLELRIRARMAGDGETRCRFQTEVDFVEGRQRSPDRPGSSQLQNLFAETTRRGGKTETGTKRQLPSREGREPTLAPYLRAGKGFPVRFRFKGKLHRARVRANGTIGYQGQVFTSPSGAAQAVTHKPSDGWKAWHHERAPGDWVPLSELRR